MVSLAPIVLFTYNRPEHTRQTIEALAKNELAAESDLIIFSDGPKDDAGIAKITAVRDYLRSITGFKTITINEKINNCGLANSVIAGVTEVVNKYGRIIVLEDDMVTSPFFLRYMNDALELYQDEEQVISIHGYMYPVKAHLPETFFLRGADCWGWATWQRGWDLFEPDGKKLKVELKAKKLLYEFDMNGSYPFSGMLDGQIKGKNDSWAIRWHASAFLKEKLTLYPGRSLLRNIGNDQSGTHSSSKNMYLEICADCTKRLKVKKIPLTIYQDAVKIISGHFRNFSVENDGIIKRLKRLLWK